MNLDIECLIKLDLIDFPITSIYIIPGIMSSWHLSQIEVVDQKANKKYLFPCNRWLSRTKDDKQLVREISCKDKICEFS